MVTGIAALLFKTFSHLREVSKQEVGLFAFSVVEEDLVLYITTGEVLFGFLNSS